MIHRTRNGSEPSGGAEQGRSIIQIGNVFIEYSGAIPTPADLQTHLSPPPPDPVTTEDRADDLVRLLIAKGLITRAELDDAKRNR